MMDQGKTSSGETRSMIIGGVATLLLGVGTATAAIAVKQDTAANPANRTLTVTRGAIVRPAFGPTDEDCVYAFLKVATPDQKHRYARKLDCAE